MRSLVGATSNIDLVIEYMYHMLTFDNLNSLGKDVHAQSSASGEHFGSDAPNSLLFLAIDC